MTGKNLKILVKWLLFILPWIVAAGLYVYSWNRGGGISGWAASMFISIVITWVWCFALYKSEWGEELETILNIAFGIMDILIAVLGVGAVIGKVIPFAVAIAAHLIAFGIFRSIRIWVYGGKAKGGGLSAAYFAVGAFLMFIAVLV